MYYNPFVDGQGVIGYVGAGHVGPGNALAHWQGLRGPDRDTWPRLIVVDLKQKALDDMAAFLERYAFAADPSLRDLVTLTTQVGDLKVADIVFESTPEVDTIKRGSLGGICEVIQPNTPIFPTSSGYTWAQLAEFVTNPERLLLLHPFTPAHFNPVVEVIGGKATDPKLIGETISMLWGIGRVPIVVKDVAGNYGHALNRVYITLAVACMYLVDQGVATPEEIDFVAKQLLKVQPFDGCDRIGGNDILVTAVPAMGEIISPYFHTPQSLLDRRLPLPEGGWIPWRSKDRPLPTEIDGEKQGLISNALLASLAWASALVDDMGIINPADFYRGTNVAFQMPSLKDGLQLLTREGVIGQIQQYAASGYPMIQVPTSLAEMSDADAAKPIPLVDISVREGVAVLRINNLRAQNNIGAEVLEELDAHLTTIEGDKAVEAVVITGAGPVFSAGADVRSIKNVRNDPEKTRPLAERGKAVFNRIRQFTKPVVAAMNGGAWGGGVELAIHCHWRLATPAVTVEMAEAKLGIFPGWEGVVILPRLANAIGDGAVAEVIQAIRTGESLNVERAMGLGIIDDIVHPAKLFKAAFTKAKALAAGGDWFALDEETFEMPAELPPPPANISHEGDAILLQVLRDSCSLPYDAASAVETEGFVAVLQTDNAERGIRNFLKSRRERMDNPFVN